MNIRAVAEGSLFKPPPRGEANALVHAAGHSTHLSLFLYISFLLAIMVDIPSAPADAYANYFVQELTPIGGSLVGSFFVGLIPLILVLVLLGIFRIPAQYAAISSLVVW